jgi:hypothetical protein
MLRYKCLTIYSMNVPYVFETEKFGLADDSLHLIGGGNYKIIPLDTITEVQVRNGKHRKYWWLALLGGLGISMYAMHHAVPMLPYLFSPEERINYVRPLLMPAFFLLFGLYLIFSSLSDTQVMIVKTSDKKYCFSLRSLIRKNHLTEFVAHMYRALPGLVNQSRNGG